MGGLGLSVQETSELWRRWKAGETVSQIARAMGRKEGVLLGGVRPHGGIAPRVRCRSRLALTLAEREEISRGLALTNRSARSRGSSAERLRVSAGRLRATAGCGGATELTYRTGVRGIER